MRYTDTLVIPGEFTLDTCQSLVEEVRGQGEATMTGLDTVTFTLDGDDLWDLALTVFEVCNILQGYGIYIDPDRKNLTKEDDNAGA